MGYQTYFSGEVDVVPPLNPSEIDFLNKFADTRRMKRKSGPYTVNGAGDFGQDPSDDIIEYNYPPDGQPGLWCKWAPTPEGNAIEWNEHEKFYDSVEWMQYLIDHFLKEGAEVQKLILRHEQIASGPLPDELRQFEHFTFNHVVAGTIYAEGEESDDRWKLVVKDNEVREVRGHVVYDDEQ